MGLIGRLRNPWGMAVGQLREDRLEAAEKIENLQALLREALSHVEATPETTQTLDGCRKQHHPIDDLVGRVRAALDD